MNFKIYLLLIFTIVKQYKLQCPNDYHFCGPTDEDKCIPNSWMCDGNMDCENGSDEFKCPNFQCKSEEIKCPNSNQCFSPKSKCDGINDCIDGADENDCKTVCDRTSQYDCRNNKYLECIPLASVCDQIKDCSTGRDLIENCTINKCFGNHTCSHICINKYSSFECDCPPNMILKKNGISCQYFDKCLYQPNMCSQRCVWKDNVSKCMCHDGYVEKQEKCVLKNQDAEIYIFYSSHQTIYGVPIFEKSDDSIKVPKLVIEAPYNIFSFEAKFEKNILEVHSTFTDQSNKLAINKLTFPKINLRDMVSTAVVNFDNFSIFGTALDPARNLLFYSDSIGNTISVINVTSSDIKKVIDQDCYYPTHLVFNPFSSKIYWIELGNFHTASKIEEANMDGTSRRTIIAHDINRPTALALDIEDQRLYWTNSYPPSINFIELNPHDKKANKVHIVLDGIYFEPVSIAIFGDKIYWSDFRHNRIYSAHKTNGKGIKAVLQTDQPNNLKIISKKLNNDLISKMNQQKVSEVCSGLVNTCPHSCLPNISFPKSSICFGFSPSGKSHVSGWWYMLIPMGFLLAICAFVVKSRFYRAPTVVTASFDNKCHYDNVKFWEDAPTDSQIDSDRLPIVNSA